MHEQYVYSYLKYIKVYLIGSRTTAKQFVIKKKTHSNWLSKINNIIKV